MIELTFKAKKFKISNSYAVIIPKPIALMLNDGKKYFFIIKEVENGENSETNMG